MQAECPSVLPGGDTNTLVAGPTLPAGDIAGSGTGGPGSGLFTVENGAGAEAAYLAFVAPTAENTTSISGKIGYLGPDYANPYSATATGLYPAALQNNFDTAAHGVNVYVLPSPAAVLKAFGALAPPESNASGGYVPATSPSQPHRNQPYAWVEPLAATSPLATPGNTISGAYPIMGTSNLLAYTCYADSPPNSVNDVGEQLNQFLTWYDSEGTVVFASPTTPGILASRGFGVMPPAWRTAIKQTFLAPTTTTSSNGNPPTNALQLWISPKTDNAHFTHNPACNSVAGAG
jgi:hypothetical protein